VNIFTDLQRFFGFVRISKDFQGFGTEYTHEERICMDLKGFARIRLDLQRFAKICIGVQGSVRICNEDLKT